MVESAGQAKNYEPGAQDPSKNPHAVALGRLGGLKDGPARATKLMPKKRSQLAAKVAKATLAQKPALQLGS